MKKVVLLGLILIGFAYSCSSEKIEYKIALECYKYRLGKGLPVLCISYRYNLNANTLEKARKWVELAKIDLDMCLMNR